VRGTATDRPRVHHPHAAAGVQQRQRGRQSDGAAAEDEDVVVGGFHRDIL